MRAKHCTCTTPPHRYLEEDSGQMWMEIISDPAVWMKTDMGYDSVMDLPTIDPEPVWAEIVAAQLKGEVDGL